MPVASWKANGPRPATRNTSWYALAACIAARPRREAQNFVKTILRLARERPTLRVVADQHCTPSYVPHVARAMLFLLGVGGSPGPLGHLSCHQSRRHDLARGGPGDRAAARGWAPRSMPSRRPSMVRPRRGPPIACWTRRPTIASAARPCPTGKRPWRSILRNCRCLRCDVVLVA